MEPFLRSSKRQVIELPISAIVPNPNQPRQIFNEAELEELAHSIAQLGILQPLSVRRTAAGWELIAGERRLRAAQRAGVRLENPFFDTYRYAKGFQAQQGWEKLNLEYLSEQFGIPQPDAHRAWCDAEANAGVYWRLKEL